MLSSQFHIDAAEQGLKVETAVEGERLSFVCSVIQTSSVLQGLLRRLERLAILSGEAFHQQVLRKLKRPALG